jgi:hypothetical protein
MYFFLLLDQISSEGINLKGMLIITFFLIFTIASILIPVPLFPGSLLSSLLGEGLIAISVLLSALFNGLIYGVIIGIVFYAISQKLEQ